MQDEGSEVEVKVDGTALKKGEEFKLGVGMTISYGSTEYKVQPPHLQKFCDLEHQTWASRRGCKATI